LHVEQTIEVGRPPGMKAGSSIMFPFVVNLGPMPLQADQTYEWRLAIDDEKSDEWRATFVTRPTSQQPG
jgi:hypothetical protein